MRVEPAPVLSILRDLWSKPRDMARFQEYLAKVKSGPDGAIFAPLVAANPMARPHMIAFVDQLDALGADRLLAEAAAEATRRLARSPVQTRLSLTPVDDVGGAWSERTMVDFAARFPEKKGSRDYGYVTAMVYVGEPATAALVRERLLAAVYRRAWWERHGVARTLREMLRQEGNALRFAGATLPPPSAAARAILDRHLDETLHATRFAAMYGDHAAERCGHKPLGLPDDAGFALALADGMAQRERPEDLV